MSYDHNLYIGWYAEFIPSTRKEQIGVTTIRVCPENKKHDATGNFCSICGSKIKITEIPKYQSYYHPHHISIETKDQRELNDSTLGRVKIEDLKPLKGSHVIFPEFVGTDYAIVMLPGNKVIRDLTRSDGFVKKVKQNEAPSLELIETIRKVFDVTDVAIKYGVVMEIV